LIGLVPDREDGVGAVRTFCVGLDPFRESKSPQPVRAPAGVVCLSPPRSRINNISSLLQLETIMNDMPLVNPVHDADVVLRPGADGWARWLGGYARGTQIAYRRDATDWFAFCLELGVDPLRATRGDMTGWIDELRQAGRAESTIARKVAALASLYSWARDEQLTDADPIPRRRPKVARDDRHILGLDRDVVRALLQAADAWGPRERAFVVLLVTCGLRVSEALGADVSDLDEVRGHHVLTVVGKGNRPRTVALPPATWLALTGYLGDRESGPIFITASGRAWDRIAAARSLDRISQRAGLSHLHPHVLRHTAATLALDAGAPLDRVQALLGHADPRTTMRYAAARERLETSAAFDVARLLGADLESELA
jgi:site-specific recombinase XerD